MDSKIHVKLRWKKKDVTPSKEVNVGGDYMFTTFVVNSVKINGDAITNVEYELNYTYGVDMA